MNWQKADPVMLYTGDIIKVEMKDGKSYIDEFQGSHYLYLICERRDFITEEIEAIHYSGLSMGEITQYPSRLIKRAVHTHKLNEIKQTGE